jgi:hypothetical protein
MKMIGKINRRSAMTRLEVLVLICVALVAAYFVVRYQKTEDLIRLSKRKAANKTNSVMEPTSQIRFVAVSDTPDETTETHETITNLIATNSVRKPTNETSLLEIAQMRLPERQKQTVRVPTNAVWNPRTPRRGSGVRIAFP